MNRYKLKKGIKALPGLPVYLKHLAYEKNIIRGQKSYQRFILLSRKRSGSTYLKSALSNHPHVEMFGEIFMSNKNIPWGKKGFEFFKHSKKYVRLLKSNPVKFLNTVIFKPYPQHVRAVGFKLFVTHAKHEETKCIWPYLKAQKNIKVLYLVRENYLANLVSKKEAIKTGIWVSGKKEKNKPVKISFDSEYLEQKFIKHEKVETYYGKYFSEHPLLRVPYEKLTENKKKWNKAIQDFLGVSYHPLVSSIRKQSSYLLSKRVQNYKELSRYFKDTRWARFFEG